MEHLAGVGVVVVVVVVVVGADEGVMPTKQVTFFSELVATIASSVVAATAL